MPAPVLLKRAPDCVPATSACPSYIGVSIGNLRFIADFVAFAGKDSRLVSSEPTQRSSNKNNQQLFFSEYGDVAPRGFGKAEQQSVGSDSMPD